MKKILFILAALPLLFAGCSEHEGEIPDETSYANKQNETYNAVRNVLVGHWVGSEQQKNGTWIELSQIDYEYTFGSDGSFYYRHYSSESEGTYSLYKNESYIEHPSYEPQVLLYLDMTIPITYSAWIDIDDRLRLDRVGTLGVVTTSDIRYTKQ